MRLKLSHIFLIFLAYTGLLPGSTEKTKSNEVIERVKSLLFAVGFPSGVATAREFATGNEGGACLDSRMQVTLRDGYGASSAFFVGEDEVYYTTRLASTGPADETRTTKISYEGDVKVYTALTTWGKNMTL